MTTIRGRIAKISTLLVLGVILNSFSHPSGGDTIEIFMNKKLLMRQFVHMDASLKTITLEPSAVKQQLEVYYRHCGQPGTSRSITARDNQDHPIQSWHFTDVKEGNACMAIFIKDLFRNNKNGEKVHLYYASKEIPNGKLIADVVLDHQVVAFTAMPGLIASK